MVLRPLHKARELTDLNFVYRHCDRLHALHCRFRFALLRCRVKYCIVCANRPGSSFMTLVRRTWPVRLCYTSACLATHGMKHVYYQQLHARCWHTWWGGKLRAPCRRRNGAFHPLGRLAMAPHTSLTIFTDFPQDFWYARLNAATWQWLVKFFKHVNENQKYNEPLIQSSI